jgi:cytochrome c oxidase subunit 2
MPVRASAGAEDVDWLYNVILTVAIVSAVGVLAVMVYLIVKYRARPRDKAEVELMPQGADHSTALEVTWSVIPLVIVVAIFIWGFKGYMDLRTSPKDALEIHVTGQKWSWTFNYNNGISDGTLHVPLGEPVRLILSSSDVIHSLFIPAFRVKMDAVPGRYTELWFEATRAGKYPVLCAEYCGTGHSAMRTDVVVHPRGGYVRWLDEQARKAASATPVELGRQLYEKQGCQTCHSTDGSPKVGPTFKGIFGRTEKLADGSSIAVDENYIRQSILEPQAQVVQGFTPSMPTYQGKLSDSQLTALIEYLKTVK